MIKQTRSCSEGRNATSIPNRCCTGKFELISFQGEISSSETPAAEPWLGFWKLRGSQSRNKTSVRYLQMPQQNRGREAMTAWLIRKRKASFKNSVEGKELGEIYSVQEKMESQRGSCSRPGRANPFSRGTVLLRRAALQGSTQQRFSSTFIPKFRSFSRPVCGTALPRSHCCSASLPSPSGIRSHGAWDTGLLPGCPWGGVRVAALWNSVDPGTVSGEQKCPSHPLQLPHPQPFPARHPGAPCRHLPTG